MFLNTFHMSLSLTYINLVPRFTLTGHDNIRSDPPQKYVMWLVVEGKAAKDLRG